MTGGVDFTLQIAHKKRISFNLTMTLDGFRDYFTRIQTSIVISEI